MRAGAVARFRLGLSAREKKALVAFLRALTGDDVEAVVRDARMALPSLPAVEPAHPPRHGEPPPKAYR